MGDGKEARVDGGQLLGVLRTEQIVEVGASAKSTTRTRQYDGANVSV